MCSLVSHGIAEGSLLILAHQTTFVSFVEILECFWYPQRLESLLMKTSSHGLFEGFQQLRASTFLSTSAIQARHWFEFGSDRTDAAAARVPVWACVLGVVLIVMMGFYLTNFMLWARREKAMRMHDLEDAKKHSEHGNMLGGLIEARN